MISTSTIAFCDTLQSHAVSARLADASHWPNLCFSLQETETETVQNRKPKKKRKRKRNKTKSIALIDGFPLSEQIARQTNPLTFATFYTHTTARSQCVCVCVLLQFSVKAAFATWCEHNNNIALSKRSRTGTAHRRVFKRAAKQRGVARCFFSATASLTSLTMPTMGQKRKNVKKKNNNGGHTRKSKRWRSSQERWI